MKMTPRHGRRRSWLARRRAPVVVVHATVPAPRFETVFDQMVFETGVCPSPAPSLDVDALAAEADLLALPILTLTLHGPREVPGGSP